MLELRPFNNNDLSLAEIWLNRKHVKRWYEIPHLGITVNDWITEIKERNGAFNWITYLVAVWQSRPVGLCLYYKCADSGEDFGNLPVEGSYGIDYLIGEKAYLGKGLGKRIINMLSDKIFSLPGAERVTAEIDKNNKVSEKALISCGFTLFEEQGCRYIKYKESDVAALGT